MFTPATDRMNNLRSSESKLLGRGRGFPICDNNMSDASDTKNMSGEKQLTLTATLAKIAEIKPEEDDNDCSNDVNGNSKEDKNIDESDIETSYSPLKNWPSNLKDNIEKMWKSWQDGEKDNFRPDDKSLLIDYEPLLSFPRNHLASISMSTLESGSIPDGYEEVDLYDPYNIDSSDALYVPLYNPDTLEYEYVPVYENGSHRDKRNSYDLTTYHERPSKYYPSDFDTKTINKPKGNSIEYFSIDEEKDPVSALYIWCSRNKAIPVFVFTSEMEARGKSVIGITFICKITLFSSSSIGRGSNKKEAKKVAAEKMLCIINSGFKDDAIERINSRLSRMEITSRPCLPNTVIIKAQEDDVKLASNPISYIQEVCLKQKWTVPDYRIETFGSLFKCSVRLFIRSEVVSHTGFGHTKKEAKINAARNLIALCQERGYISMYR